MFPLKSDNKRHIVKKTDWKSTYPKNEVERLANEGKAKVAWWQRKAAGEIRHAIVVGLPHTIAGNDQKDWCDEARE
jgi:glutathione S-transferase